MSGREESPLVSIIVPSYNQGRFLRQTLESILSQDYRPIEVLVMDGGSRDESVAILKEFAARYPELSWVSEPDKGPADAINKGLARARGVFAGIQSSDDLYHPGAIREAVAELQADPGLALVCADMNLIDSEGRFIMMAGNRAPFSLANVLSRTTVVHQSSTFFRLEIAQRLGGWNPKYFCCDTDLWIRIGFQARGKRMERTWSSWRVHEEQRDRDKRRYFDSWRQMIADCEPLRSAPLHLRLAAEAGCSSMAMEYNPTGSRWFRLLHAWRAVLIYPPAIAGINPKTVLLPGATGVWSRLRALLAPGA